MADAEAVRVERRDRLRRASGADSRTRLGVMRQVIDELPIDQSRKRKLYEAVNAVFRAEADLNNVLGDKSASAEMIETHLQKYRNACKAVIVLDYEFAYDALFEEQLRVKHANLRTAYREKLQELRKQKERHAETRRTHKEYMQFIKASQLFYRQLVLELDRIHGGIPGIRKAAQNWRDVNGRESSAPVPPPSYVDKQHLLLAVQRTLLILGDLSRWRATDLDGQKPNRGAALGYYHLANEIYPPSGIAWNQLALVERESENVNHLQVLYYLYRGLCATEVRSGPKANLNTNLKSVFDKIVKMMEKKQLFPNMSKVGNGVAGALMSWFLWLQTMCFKGEDCPKFKELEKEVMSQLTNEVKKGAGSIETLLQKIVLISLGGDYVTANKLKEGGDDKVMQSFFYYLRFNARLFHTLLQLLNSELEFVGDRQDVKNKGASAENALADKVTAIMRRIMPALRFFSVWFQSYWRILGADIPGYKITPLEVQELWHSYVHSLNLMSASFPIEKLPMDDYLLPEDDETLGFGPFFEQNHHRNWYNSKGLKPKPSDKDTARNLPNTETLIRVRGFLLDAEALCSSENAPVTTSLQQVPSKQGTLTKIFRYRDPEEARDEPVNQQLPQQEYPQPSIPASDAVAPIAFAVRDGTSREGTVDEGASLGPAPPETASMGPMKDYALSRMVDNLLDEDEVTAGVRKENAHMSPTTPHQQSFNLASSPLTHHFNGSPNFETYQSFHPAHADFPLFSSSTSPRPVGSVPPRSREEAEVAEMSRRLSNIGRPGTGTSPLARPLPAFPSLPDESARIWGIGYPSPAQGLVAAPGLPRPSNAASQTPTSYGNGYDYRGSVGSMGASGWLQYSSPTTESMRRDTVPQLNHAQDNGYSSPPGLDRSLHGYSQSQSSPYAGTPGSSNTPSGLGSAALGGSALPPALGMGGFPGLNRRAQWPAS